VALYVDLCRMALSCFFIAYLCLCACVHVCVHVYTCSNVSTFFLTAQLPGSFSTQGGLL
jgi:hypothetical protein